MCNTCCQNFSAVSDIKNIGNENRRVDDMCSKSKVYPSIAVADPGFPRGGGANTRGGVLAYDFAKFSPKLHEIERIWTPRGVRVPHAPP